MLCSSRAGRDTDSMAKQPENTCTWVRVPGCRTNFRGAGGSGRLRNCRQAPPPPGHGELGDNSEMTEPSGSTETRMTARDPLASTVYLRLLRGKTPQTHVRFWRFRHSANGCVLHWRIWRPDLEVIGSVLRWGCQRHSRCDQTPNRPGVVKDSGAMVVPSREQPRIFPGGRSVAGIPKVCAIASSVPAFLHEDVHQVDPEEEEAEEEGEPEEDEEEEAEEDAEGEEPEEDEEQEQQQRRAVASATTGTTRL